MYNVIQIHLTHIQNLVEAIVVTVNCALNAHPTFRCLQIINQANTKDIVLLYLVICPELFQMY